MNSKKTQRKSLIETLASAMDSLPVNDPKAIEDAHVYITMTEEGLRRLPAFWDDGSVRFYEIGGVLLGKSALMKFVETIKNR